MDDQGTLLREPYAEANLDTAGSSINDIGKKFLIGACGRARCRSSLTSATGALLINSPPRHTPRLFPAAERLSAARQAVGMA